MHPLKEPGCGATTPSNNSLRLTHNMHTLKEPERGATTPSNKEPERGATTPSKAHIHTLYMHTHARIQMY